MSTATAPSEVQPIAGVVPCERKETTVMTVWPSVARYGLGRTLGTLFAIAWPEIYIFRLGNLIALLAIPIALVLYFVRIAPFIGVRYRLTNRRIIVERGLTGVLDKAVDLDRFDPDKVDRFAARRFGEDSTSSSGLSACSGKGMARRLTICANISMP